MRSPQEDVKVAKGLRLPFREDHRLVNAKKLRLTVTDAHVTKCGLKLLQMIRIARCATRGYGEIKKGLLRDISGSQEIAPRVLSRELKTLGAFGLINRTEYHIVPPKVEYSLTPLGQSLLPILSSIIVWGKQHLLGDTAHALNEERSATSGRS